MSARKQLEDRARELGCFPDPLPIEPSSPAPAAPSHTLTGWVEG